METKSLSHHIWTSRQQRPTQNTVAKSSWKPEKVNSLHRATFRIEKYLTASIAPALEELP
eukprot:1141812-Pelagomonas_calceolata.AAC.5